LKIDVCLFVVCTKGNNLMFSNTLSLYVLCCGVVYSTSSRCCLTQNFCGHGMTRPSTFVFRRNNFSTVVYLFTVPLNRLSLTTLFRRLLYKLRFLFSVPITFYKACRNIFLFKFLPSTIFFVLAQLRILYLLFISSYVLYMKHAPRFT
jgi:hypothetical protein